jgi:hypothetical protein
MESRLSLEQPGLSRDSQGFEDSRALGAIGAFSASGALGAFWGGQTVRGLAPRERKTPMRSARCVVPCLLIGLLAIGCGKGYINAKGRVTKGGEPFRPGEGEALRIILAPLDAPAGATYDSYAAEFNPDDSTFLVKGKDGKGLPPGKYRVGVELIKKKEDQFKGRFTGPKSPFTCEVASTASELIVDLDQESKPDVQQRAKRREER